MWQRPYRSPNSAGSDQPRLGQDHAAGVALDYADPNRLTTPALETRP